MKVMRACQNPALHTVWQDKGPVGIASLSNHDFHRGFRIKCPNMQSSSPGAFENSSLCKISGGAGGEHSECIIGIPNVESES